MTTEQAFTFDSGDNTLLGIIHEPSIAVNVGVLIIVGGPQYRVGSHRQFILLARDLVGAGIPVMRFDYHGMGDSNGELASFEDCEQDVKAAIDVFNKKVPKLEKIVIWGLCDAASAAMFYAHQDSRIAGLVLLNPWVRTEAGEAKAYMKHYYIARIKSPEFWRKLLGGKLNIKESLFSLRNIVSKMLNANRKCANDETNKGDRLQSLFNQSDSLPDRMLKGMKLFSGRMLFILSGDDLTAGEFKDLIEASPQWKSQMNSDRIEQKQIVEANHTFSTKEWRDQVSRWTTSWVLGLK